MKWINVKDKVPPQPKRITTNKKYWCALKCGLCELIDWRHTLNGYHEFIHNEDLASPIAYWMELPKAPNWKRLPKILKDELLD